MLINRFIKSNYEKQITVPIGSKFINTGIPSSTGEVSLNINSNVDIDGKYQLVLNKDSYIEIIFLEETRQELNLIINRTTPFNWVAGTNNKVILNNVKQFVQALQDLAMSKVREGLPIEDATSGEFNIIAAIRIIISKIKSILLGKHTLSLNAPDDDKQDKNPVYGDADLVDTVSEDVGGIIKKFNTNYPLGPISEDQESGLYLLPSAVDRVDPTYTPLKSIEIEDGSLKIVLKRGIYDPRFEDKRLIELFTINGNNDIIVVGPYLRTNGEFSYKQTAGEITLTIDGFSSLGRCQIGIILNGNPVPLEVNFLKDRI